MTKPIIAIDGPAGAGKSTVTKRVAAELGLLFLDTGAMYRAITWLVLKSNIPLDDEVKITELVNGAKIELIGDRVLINGEDITQAIRTPEVTGKVSTIAALGVVREALVRQQQAIALQARGANSSLGGIVAEGRDMCTHVFPQAEVKIFLTATVAERARRRQQDLVNQGQGQVDLESLEREIARRDEMDSNRTIAPLKKADDAVEIITDGMTIEEVVKKIVTMYHAIG
jgi:pantoate ligase/cytidylate kinase